MPFLLKKPLWSYRMATWTWGLITGGVAIFWLYLLGGIGMGVFQKSTLDKDELLPTA